MALCPQCDHSILVHTLLTDDLAGYSCGKCLGTLVSLVTYRVGQLLDRVQTDELFNDLLISLVPRADNQLHC